MLKSSIIELIYTVKLKMISEIVLFSILSTTAFNIKNHDKNKIRDNFMKIIYRSDLVNRQKEIPKIKEIKLTDYGYYMVISLPWGVTYEEFEKELDIFKEGLKLESIHTSGEKGIVKLNCIKKYNFIPYGQVKLKPYEILLGDRFGEYVIVNLNKFPHVLIGGDTGTGKSRLLLVLLTNSLHSGAEFYLLQNRKNDLGVFKNCKQVRAFSKNLDEILESLIAIDNICQHREELIDNTKGIYNIEDFNRTAVYKLKYIFVVIDEFSFLNVSKGDSKYEKELKYKCLRYIKSIVNVGRSSGVFLITSLQKPTNDSIPTDIKAQLTTRISLTIKDKSTSVVVMGDNSATTLKEREFVCKTLDTVKGFTMTIDHDLIMSNINTYLINKTRSVKPIDPVKSNVEDILSKINEITE
jgi:S-DNA-T family DNA segregation ATPase FtsK/SpoIIIE